jgi:hypothetical protein
VATSIAIRIATRRLVALHVTVPIGKLIHPTLETVISALLRLIAELAGESGVAFAEIGLGAVAMAAEKVADGFFATLPLPAVVT